MFSPGLYGSSLVRSEKTTLRGGFLLYSLAAMRAKDLKSNYSFESRRPYLADHVLYVPEYYASYGEYEMPPFTEIFGNAQPVYIEYCSGNGDWIAQQALREPGKNWIAVELRFDRVRKIWAKLKNYNLSNLLIVCGEALTFTHHYVPTASVEGCYIHFPDPWPKRRHAKNRLLKPSFLDEMARILRGEGGVTFVSDDIDYVRETVTLLKNHTHFKPDLEFPHFTTRESSYGSSWFEQLWREKGKEIHYTEFARHADSH